MNHFETQPQPTTEKAESLFTILADFRKMEQLFPKDKVKNWQTDGNSCRFQVDGIGEIGLIISKKEPSSLIQYTGHGKVPFNFNIQVHLLHSADLESVKVTAEAKLNPMLKMMATKPIQKFLNILCESIAKVKL